VKQTKNAPATLRVPEFNVVDFYHGHQGSTKVPGGRPDRFFPIIGTLKCTAMNYQALGRFPKKNVLLILGRACRDQLSSQAYAQHIFDNLANRYPITGVTAPQLADNLLRRVDEAFVALVGTPAAQCTRVQANAVALSRRPDC